MAVPAGTIQQPCLGCKLFLRFGAAGSRGEVALKRARRLLLPVVLVVASILVVGAKKIFDYAAAPDKEKESDFVFPHNPDQEKPTVLLAELKSPPFTLEQRGGFVNDTSHLNKTAVYGVVRITSEDDIRNALQFARDHNLKVTCAGQQHSMGGQTFTHDGLVLDLRNFNHIRLDKEHKSVNLQSGVRWWQLQQLLDTEGLSVKSMQSINIFSVGGTLSINAHGIDPMPGPIAPTVRSLRVMLSDGSIVQASPTENSELFRHVLGGYGLFGVILDVNLDIVDNEMYSRETLYMNYTDFPKYYQANVENNKDMGLIFGRLSVSPQSFLRETAVHAYLKTPFDSTLPPDEVDTREICRTPSSRLCVAESSHEPEGSVPGAAQRGNVRRYGISEEPLGRHRHPAGVLHSLRPHARICGWLARRCAPGSS